jgi:hypothetical protein
MNKAQLLREHLMASTALDLNGTDVLLSVSEGELISSVGSENKHFKVAYTADLTLLNFSGRDDVLFFVIREWLDQVQPLREPTAFHFDIDVLDNNKADVNIRIRLNEVVKVRVDADGTRLFHPDDPQNEVAIPGVPLRLTAVDTVAGESCAL